MIRTSSGACALLCAALSIGNAQVKRTSVPMADALTKALEKSLLTASGAQPFHIRITIAEPENPQSPYQGSIEEWWSSPEKWRREVTSGDSVRQTIVFKESAKSEQDIGDYFPLWLRNFVTAAFEPVPNIAAWSGSRNTIDQITMPNGDRSDACTRAKLSVGSGDRATDTFTNVCFDGQGRLSFYGSPRYSMEFHGYRNFGKKQFPRQFSCDPEPGTKLVGEVVVLEDLPKVSNADTLFAPLDRNDDRFQSIPVNDSTLEKLSQGVPQIAWPPVHSGNVRGHLAIYISADANGHVREVWPLNSDNAGLQDPARDQVRQWKLKIATNQSGQPVQIDGALGFSFDTTIGDPLPELTDAEVRALATKIVEPIWTPGTLKPGDVVEVQVSVNQQSKLAGIGLAKVPPAAIGPIMEALHLWTFKPLVRDNKPQYFHGTVRFVVP